ncbi:MAG: methyltransferase domain-containing protein [Candidatus Sumerlaeia bacterium]
MHHSATELECLGQDAFDFVLDGFLLHCLIGDDRPAYLRQVHHVLKPDGIFMLQSFCAEDISAPQWQDWKIDPQTRYQYAPDGTATKYIGNRDAIHKILHQTGFQIIHEKTSPIGGGMLIAHCQPCPAEQEC